MQKISAAQSKAGRVFLEWSQEDLAKNTGLSLSTIRSFENGMSPRASTLRQICKTLERSGIEFTEGGGVKPRSDYVRMYMGHDSCNQFFEDVIQTIQEQRGDIVCVAQSQNMMIQSLGLSPQKRFEYLEALGKITSIKCIVPDAVPASQVPTIQFRTLPKHYTGPWSYYVFGDKYAHILQEGSSFCFVVFHKPIAAHDYHNHFLALWNQAMPIKTTLNFPERYEAKSV